MERYYYNETFNKNLMGKVLSEFFVLLLLCTVGMIFGRMFIPPQLASLAAIGTIVILIFAAFTRRSKNKNFSRTVCFSVAFLMGISTYPTILYYLSYIGSEMVLISLGITTAVFGGLALYSSKTKRDFTFLGGTLYIGLIAMLLISIVGFFIRTEVYHLALAWFGIMIFSGYVLYDISIIRSGAFTEEDVPMLALNLFLDFINIFIYVLRIVSRFSSRD